MNKVIEWEYLRDSMEEIQKNNGQFKWTELNTVNKIESTREFKNLDKPMHIGTRYYISSLIANPEDFLRIIRSHWYIENKLHWILDIAYSEDASRKKRNAAQNFSVLMKIALNFLKIKY